jgi:hypothetical protein
VVERIVIMLEQGVVLREITRRRKMSRIKRSRDDVLKEEAVNRVVSQ